MFTQKEKNNFLKARFQSESNRAVSAWCHLEWHNSRNNYVYRKNKVTYQECCLSLFISVNRNTDMNTEPSVCLSTYMIPPSENG